MDKRFVLNIVSRILAFTSVIMLLPLGMAVYDDPHSLEVKSFIITILSGIILFAIVQFLFNLRKISYNKIASAKNGLAVVGLSWIVLSLWGAFPLLLSKVVPSYTDAVFEIASGFTTTGASIFRDVEILPRGILFWRSLTHWLGGMGVIVLFITILPVLGTTSSQLYKIETSGLDTDKASGPSRIIARKLWAIYFLITGLSVALLIIGGMPLFDSLCHSFGAIATGGFSTKNTSIGGYSAYIQWVITFIMFLGGINFAIYCYLTIKKWKLFRDNGEFRVYLGIILFSIPVFFLFLRNTGLTDNPLRAGAFQIVSILTATGYSTANFDIWPNGLRMMLVIFMFIGGCAGSTSGGLKIIRAIISTKSGLRYVRQTVSSPRSIMLVKYDSKVLSEDTIRAVFGFMALYGIFFLFGSFFLLASEPSCDIETATTASIACLSTVGPGLGKVGPLQNYAWISAPGKWVLSFLMLAGRLELYAILALFIPRTWQK